MDFKKQQQIQYQHDLSNHFDILAMSRVDRIKHYGLHFAKYAGRFARGNYEKKSESQTLVDAFLVSLSAANALNQLLEETLPHSTEFAIFTDYSGRFADACEKIDHLEEFRDHALNANSAIMGWLVAFASIRSVDIVHLAAERRNFLARRAVYAEVQ
ncbi:hypothetical protein [Pelagibacterium montanilacus]|uniref:hypothetical protein n=1 Tax=Pelagibacterium montanilacus TaxID=2185280 RepID=UPI000F8ED322|nr:hypothetical protein [Pelagibacterium montanilacus]